VRIRDAYPEESTEANAKCRIDHPGVQFVTEESGAVVPAVKAENAHIGQLTLPNDKPVWFAGTVSRGPVRLVSGHPPTAQSALYITDKIQYVTETPEAVRNAVAAAGGTALPIPPRASLRRLRTCSANSARLPRRGTDLTAGNACEIDRRGRRAVPGGNSPISRRDTGEQPEISTPDPPRSGDRTLSPARVS
jgi:hypothetical protein